MVYLYMRLVPNLYIDIYIIWIINSYTYYVGIFRCRISCLRYIFTTEQIFTQPSSWLLKSISHNVCLTSCLSVFFTVNFFDHFQSIFYLQYLSDYRAVLLATLPAILRNNIYFWQYCQQWCQEYWLQHCRPFHPGPICCQFEVDLTNQQLYSGTVENEGNIIQDK